MTEASFTTDTHDLFKKLIAAAAATTIFAPRVLLHWPRAAHAQTAHSLAQIAAVLLPRRAPMEAAFPLPTAE